MKTTVYNNVPDIKRDGEWVGSYTIEPYTSYRTRSYCLWCEIKKRTNPDGAYQKRNNSYVGCRNLFSNFQEFAEWCQSEYGYLNKETDGRFWSIDKDILGFGNNLSSYSKDTCIFIPQQINKFFKNTKNLNGYPLGVCYHSGYKKILAQCSDGNGRSKHLGYFNSPHEAHRAWQKYKIEIMKSFLKKETVIGNKKLLTSIEARIIMMIEQYENFVETTKI